MDRGIMGKGGVCWLIPQGRETDTIRQMLRWKQQKQTWGGKVFSRELKDDGGTESSGEGRAEVDEEEGDGKNEKRRGRT